MPPIKFFEYKRENLTNTEKSVVDILVDLGEVVHAIWKAQLDPETAKSLFYPLDTNREEVLNASKNKPEILSPYSIVKRDEKGELYAVAYEEEYKDLIEKAVELLKKACIESNDHSLNSYLGSIANALETADFDALEDLYVQNHDSKIEIMLGPIETYEDKILSVKKAFQYSLRILNESATEEVSEMVDIIRKMHILRPEGSIASDMETDNIFVRVDSVVMLAGRQSRVLLSSSNHPNDPERVKKLGSKVTIFTTSMYEKFDKKLAPLVEKALQGNDYNLMKMKKATLRLVALHEITEGVIKFDNMQERLGSHHDYIRELNADIFGVHSAKYHVLKGLIDSQQYEDLLTMFILFAVDTCNSFEHGGSIEEYSKGFAVIFNYFNQTGSVKFSKQSITIDHTKLSRDIEAIANIVLQIIKDGNEKDAQKLLDEYGDYAIFDQLPSN